MTLNSSDPIQQRAGLEAGLESRGLSPPRERPTGDGEAVTVCIATYRRPKMLHSLLLALGAQQLPPGLTFSTVVVDNDAAASALPVCETLRTSLPFPLSYLTEPIQNISLARNRAVAAATGEWVAFVDDDERPGPEWLASLWTTAKRMECDGVFGPVVPVFGAGTPQWLKQGRFYERPRYPTGMRLRGSETRTANAIVRTRILQFVPGPFDPNYGADIGHDDQLFDTLERKDGAAFVWCDEAVVEEEVPASRATLRWLLWRAFRGGQVHIQHIVALSSGRKVLVLALGRAGLLFPVAILMGVILFPTGRCRSVWWLRKAVAQLGKLLAFTRFRPGDPSRV